MYIGKITNIHWERVFITIEGQLESVDSTNQMYDYFRLRKPNWFDPETGDPITEYFEEFDNKLKELTQKIIPEYHSDKIYFFLRTDGYAQAYLLEPTLHEDLTFSITINVTNFENRAQIPNGTFYLSVLHNGIDFSLNSSVEVAAKAFEVSRSFLFDKDSQCYTVNISSTSNELDPRFQLKSFLFSRKRERKFRWKRVLRETKDQIVKKTIQIYYNILYALVPKNGKRILIATETRGALQGNLAAIHHRMLERGLDKQYKIHMSFRRAAGEYSSALSWIKLITYVAISDIVLLDDYAPFLEWLEVKKKTRIIQVWHAGVGFKSVGFCRFGANASPKLNTGHRKYTYAITGSSKLKHVYSEVFGIEEENIIPTGLPRIDELLNEEKNDAFKKNFYKSYPKLQNKKIILFAPTFRGTGQKTAYYPYHLIDFHALYETCGNEYVFMFKMHPFITEEAPIPEAYKDRIVDFTTYPDVNELLQITDILITDYSSIIYEYSLFKRPMIFFAYDKDSYSTIRGFHNDFDSFAPGKICSEFADVLTAIQNHDFETEKVDQFVEDNFDYIDENSSDRFIDWLILNTTTSETRH